MEHIQRRAYPILEFDPEEKAIIEPSELIDKINMPDRCVITFFQEVIDELNEQNRLSFIINIKSAIGNHPLYELECNGKKVTVFHAGLGAPLSGGILEEVIALGGRKFIACGGAGVLKEEIAVGHLVIPTTAVRDEGVSYHYIPPGREVEATPAGINAIKRVLQKHDVGYVSGKTWTTSSFYRETPDKVKLRKDEGCITVEMECAAFFAIAKFRGVQFAQILYGGDDVSGDVWDSRKWDSRMTVREKVFWLAVESCLEYDL